MIYFVNVHSVQYIGNNDIVNLGSKSLACFFYVSENLPFTSVYNSLLEGERSQALEKGPEPFFLCQLRPT
jgi:hypothetical protein